MEDRRDSNNAGLDRIGALRPITTRIAIPGPLWALYVAAFCLAALPATSLPVKKMGLRPGVPAARVLWKVADPAEWEKSLCKYDVALRAVGVKRKKEKDLVKWDAAMDTLKTRFEAQGKLSLSDLETVMNWKLTKGKFRPLMNLFLSNSPSLVQNVNLRKVGQPE